jgi:hypothetical protein
VTSTRITVFCALVISRLRDSISFLRAGHRGAH